MNKDFDIIDMDKTGPLPKTDEEALARAKAEEEEKVKAQEKAGIHVQVLSILVDELRAAVREGNPDHEAVAETENGATVSEENDAETVPGEEKELPETESAETTDTEITESTEAEINEPGSVEEKELCAEEAAEEVTDAETVDSGDIEKTGAAESGYTDEENAEDHVFQGEISVDTMLLTDISEEIRRDLQETQVIDADKVRAAAENTEELDMSKIKMVGSETMQMIDLDSDLFEVLGGRIGGEYTDEEAEIGEDIKEEYADEDIADSEGEYSDEDTEYPEEEYVDEETEYEDPDGYYEDEYYEDGDAEYADETEDIEYLEDFEEEGYYEDGATEEAGYNEEDVPDGEIAYDTEGVDPEETNSDEASAEPNVAEAEEVVKAETSAQAHKATGTKKKHGKHTQERNGKKTSSQKKSGKHRKAAGNKQGQENPSAAKRSGNHKTHGAKNNKSSQQTKQTDELRFVKIAAVAIVLFAIGMTFLIHLNWKGNGAEQGKSGYMYEVGESLASIGMAGENGLNALAEAGRLSQVSVDNGSDTPDTVEPTAAVSDEGILVEVTFTSLEQDLKIKFIDQESRRLITDVAFEVHLQPKSGDMVTLVDADLDGIIYEKGIKSGDYSIEVVPADGYQFVGVQDMVNVREKIAYQQIDVAQEIKKESEINVAAEDTGVSLGAAGAPQVTMPALPTETPTPTPTPSPTLANGDTVEWVESTKTPVTGGGSGYKQVGKDSISAPSYAMRNVVEVQNDGYAAIPCQGALRTLVRTEAEPTVTDTGAAAETPTPEATATPTPTPEATATPTPEATATPTPEATATPTPTAEATAIPTATPTPTAEATATPSPVTQRAVKDVVLDKSGFSLTAGNTETITATATLDDDSKITEGTKFSWSSSDSSIVKVDEAGKVTAVKTGSATITATYKDGNGDKKSASCMVSVVSDPKQDTSSRLRDKNGNQVYVLNSNGQYVEATYADYYSKSEFYILGNTEYTYTGWQVIDGKTYFYDRTGKKVTGEQQIQGVKYVFDADGALKQDGNKPSVAATPTATPTPTVAQAPVATNGPVIGIDVSKWNGSIDWNAVKASGVQFVIIRCGYRGSTSGVLVEDSKFRSNIQGATAAGLKVGVYFFSQAINEVEAVEEASMTIAMMQGYGIQYPVFIDTEFTTGRNGRADGLDKGARSAVCRAFCETIRSAGYTPGVYCSKAWLGPSVDLNVIGNYKIWMAHYVQQTDYTGRYDMWQFTKNGSIAGISGAVDMNYGYLGY